MFCIANLNNTSKVSQAIRNTQQVFVAKYGNRNAVPDRFWLLTLLLPDKEARILDIGPNIYVFQDLIADHQREKYRYHSMDLQHNNLGEWATESVHDANQDPYPFPDETFDLVIATDVIEHIQNTDIFLKNVHRLLAPDGQVLITTPNYGSIGSVLKIFQGKMFHDPLGTEIDRYCFQEHVKYFTLNNFLPYLSFNKIFPSHVIRHGFHTYLPFTGNSFVKRLLVQYLYNRLISLGNRFCPELVIIAGKKETSIQFISV